MRYELMGTRSGSFRDAEGDYWYEVDGGADMGTFDATGDDEARKIAATSFEGREVDESDPRAKIVGRGSAGFVGAFVSGDGSPYILRVVQ